MKNEILTISAFSAAALIASMMVWLPSGRLIDDETMLCYSAGGILSAAFWSFVVAGRLADPHHKCSLLRATLCGACVSFLSVFSFMVVCIIGAGTLEFFQGQFPEASEHLLQAIPVGVTLGFTAFMVAGSQIIPVGAVTGFLLRFLVVRRAENMVHH